MSKLQINNKEIIDTFQYTICQNSNEAIELGVNDYGWDKSDILDRREKVSVKLDDGTIQDLELDCIMVDSGSEDYIYYLP